ncbi:MAG: FG-GAP-like repeat-containing protein [Cyclobacteriaceae bacterium]
MEKYKTILHAFIYLIFPCVISSHHAISQSFREKPIRDLTKMANNYGCAVADYDQDGDLDVFIVAYDHFLPDSPKTWSRLLKNFGNGRFEDVTVQAGFAIQYKSSVVEENKYGASWGDYDNDGFSDLLLTHTGKVQLYRNKGDGTFKDVTRNSGIKPCISCINMGAIWWDYNRDGQLDLYINNHVGKNRLFRNTGMGKFENLTDSTILADEKATWSSLPFDANDDGWPDLLVLNDFGQSRFYINHDGKGFTEETQAYGLQNPGDAMGGALGDYDNDGYFDIYITNISEFYPNRLFSRKADGVYQDVAIDLEVGVGHWAWGTNFFDADHDGDEDLYIVNGMDAFVNENKFYKNMLMEGEAGFVDWSTPSMANGKDNGMGSEVFDFDDDGDLDILVSNTNDAPVLYENISIGGRTWLQVELEGQKSNRNAFGAIVSAWTGEKNFQRYHHGTGIMMQSIKPVHFGLGTASRLDSLKVFWPSGYEQILYDVPVNQKIRITEGVSLEPTIMGINTLNDKGDLNVYPSIFDSKVQFILQKEHAKEAAVRIYSIKGNLIFDLNVSKKNSQGNLSWEWNGKDAKGKALSPGIFIYRVQSDVDSWFGKLIFEP